MLDPQDEPQLYVEVSGAFGELTNLVVCHTDVKLEYCTGKHQKTCEQTFTVMKNDGETVCAACSGLTVIPV